MTTPKLIIFDLDGTLVEFPHHFIYSEAERIIALLEHPEVTRNELVDHFTAFDFFRFVPEATRHDFTTRFWEIFDWRSYPKSVTFEWTAAILGIITARGIPIAIATARLSSDEDIRKDLDSVEWLKHIGEIHARHSEEVHWKDKTSQITAICRNYNVDPADVVMVGDIPPDIESAKLAGIGTTVAVLSGGLRRDILEAARPDFLLQSIAQLPLVLWPDETT